MSERCATLRLPVGDRIAARELVTIHRNPISIPEAGRLVHLQFRRYAGCPACNLHLRSIVRRHDEILAAGISEVVVFHSARETMLGFQGTLPFAAIADPDKKLYAEFGVGQMSPLSALDPRSWRAVYRALTRSPSLRGAMGVGEGHMGLPADFLIGPDGAILAVKYGAYVDDHWSVDDVLALGQRTASAAGPPISASPAGVTRRTRPQAPTQSR